MGYCVTYRRITRQNKRMEMQSVPPPPILTAETSAGAPDPRISEDTGGGVLRNNAEVNPATPVAESRNDPESENTTILKSPDLVERWSSYQRPAATSLLQCMVIDSTPPQADEPTTHSPRANSDVECVPIAAILSQANERQARVLRRRQQRLRAQLEQAAKEEEQLFTKKSKSESESLANNERREGLSPFANKENIDELQQAPSSTSPDDLLTEMTPKEQVTTGGDGSIVNPEPSSTTAEVNRDELTTVSTVTVQDAPVAIVPFAPPPTSSSIRGIVSAAATSAKRRFVLYDEDSQNSPLTNSKSKVPDMEVQHSHKRPPPSVPVNSTPALVTVPSSSFQPSGPSSVKIPVRRPISESLQTPLPRVPDFNRRSPSSQMADLSQQQQTTKPPPFVRSSFVRPVAAYRHQLSPIAETTAIANGPSDAILPSEPVSKGFVPTMFTTGSGKAKKVSEALLAKVAVGFEIDSASSSAIPVVQDGLVDNNGQTVSASRVNAEEKMINVSSGDGKQPKMTGMVDSIFSTGTGKQLSVSKTALDRAALVVNGTEGESSTSSMVQSIFSSGAGKQLMVSSVALDRAAQVFDGNSEDAATVKTPSLALKGRQYSPSVETTKPSFFPPRPVEATKGASIALATTTNRSGASSTKQFVRPRPSGTGTGTSSTSPPPPAIQPGISSRRSIPSSPLPRPSKQTRLPPLRIPKTVVLNHASPVLLSISASNAANVSFAMDRSSPTLNDGPCMWTLSAIREILFLTVNDTNRLTLEWVANHFRWVVWKLGCLERLSSCLPHTVVKTEQRLCFDNVVQQLSKRAEKELQRGEESVLARMVAGELPARAVVVLVMSRVLVACNPDKSCTVEVSDGWYGVEAVLDESLALKVRQGRFIVGQKFMVSHWRFEGNGESHLKVLELNCNRVLSEPLQIKQPRLFVSINHSKPCSWEVRLGYPSFAGQAVYKTIAQLKANGGIVPKTTLFVCRISPIMYRERGTGTSNITRTLQEEEMAAAEFYQRRQAYKERATSRFLASLHLDEETVSKIPRDRLEQMLSEYMSKDPERPFNLERRVSTVLRLIVKDASTTKATILTVMNPSESLQDQLREGALCTVTKVNVSRSSSSSELRLFADEQSQWRFERNHDDGIDRWTKFAFPRRSFQRISVDQPMCDSVLVFLPPSAAAPGAADHGDGPQSQTMAFAIQAPLSLTGANDSLLLEKQQSPSSELVAISFVGEYAKQRLSCLFSTAQSSSTGTTTCSVLVVAVRDLAVRSFDSRTGVVNCAVVDITHFSQRPSSGPNKSSSLSVSKMGKKNEGFSHLSEAFERTREWMVTSEGVAAIEKALKRRDQLVLGGNDVEEEVMAREEGSSRGEEDFQREETERDQPIVVVSGGEAQPMEMMKGDRKESERDQPVVVVSDGDAQRTIMNGDDLVLAADSNPSIESNQGVSATTTATNGISTERETFPSSTTTVANGISPGGGSFSSSMALRSSPTLLVLPKESIAQLNHLTTPSNRLHSSNCEIEQQRMPPLTTQSSASAFPPTTTTTISNRSKPNSSTTPMPMKLIVKADALSYVMAGRKTMEARVNRGAFKKIVTGMKVRFESGSQHQDCFITLKKEFASFKQMVETEDRHFKLLMPWLTSPEGVLNELKKMHGADDMEYGAVLFSFECCDHLLQAMTLSSAATTPSLMIVKTPHDRQESFTTPMMIMKTPHESRPPQWNPVSSSSSSMGVATGREQDSVKRLRGADDDHEPYSQGMQSVAITKEEGNAIKGDDDLKMTLDI